MMTLEMTAQLAPVAWGMFALLLVSAVGIIVAALPRAGSAPKVGRPTRALHPVSLPASA